MWQREKNLWKWAERKKNKYPSTLSFGLNPKRQLFAARNRYRDRDCGLVVHSYCTQCKDVYAYDHGQYTCQTLNCWKEHHVTPCPNAQLIWENHTWSPASLSYSIHTARQLTWLLHSDGSHTSGIHTMRGTMLDSLEEIFRDDWEKWGCTLMTSWPKLKPEKEVVEITGETIYTNCRK